MVNVPQGSLSFKFQDSLQDQGGHRDTARREDNSRGNPFGMINAREDSEFEAKPIPVRAY